MNNLRYSILCLATLSIGTSTMAMEIISPPKFSFKMTAQHGSLDCDTVLDALGKYAADQCLDGRESADCRVDGNLLVIASGMKTFSESGGMTFAPVNYSVESSYEVQNAPANYTNDFNKSYVHDVSLLTTDGDLSFSPTAGSSAVQASLNLSIPTVLEAGPVDGINKTVILRNKLLACSLEKHLVKIMGKSKVSVSSYHPDAAFRMQVVTGMIRKASQLNVSDFSLSKKQFLLGATAGDLLKSKKAVFSESEFESTLLSLQKLVLKSPDESLDLNGDSAPGAPAETMASTLLGGHELIVANVELVLQ